MDHPEALLGLWGQVVLPSPRGRAGTAKSASLLPKQRRTQDARECGLSLRESHQVQEQGGREGGTPRPRLQNREERRQPWRGAVSLGLMAPSLGLMAALVLRWDLGSGLAGLGGQGTKLPRAPGGRGTEPGLLCSPEVWRGTGVVTKVTHTGGEKGLAEGPCC